MSLEPSVRVHILYFLLLQERLKSFEVDLVQEGTERGRTPEEVKDYTKKIDAKVFETSAKTGQGIDELFQDIAETYVRKLSGGGDQSSTSSSTSTIQHNNAAVETKQHKKCCS